MNAGKQKQNKTLLCFRRQEYPRGRPSTPSDTKEWYLHQRNHNYQKENHIPTLFREIKLRCSTQFFFIIDPHVTILTKKAMVLYI